MKKTLLNTAIAATFLAGSAGVFAADPKHNGDLGDSRIHYPLAGDTIYGSATDVWFVAATDADFYTIDLRAYNDKSNDNADPKGCGRPDPDNDTHIVNMFSVNDPLLECGTELVGTVPVTGFYDKNHGDITNDNDSDGEADFHLCKWRTPDLPKGNYQIAVNSIKLGHHSITENRFNCLNTAGQIANKAAETVIWALNPTGSFAFSAMTEGVNSGLYLAKKPDLIGYTDRALPVGTKGVDVNKHRDPSSYSYSPFSLLPDTASLSTINGIIGGSVPSVADLAALVTALAGIVPSETGGDRNYQTFEIIPSARVTRVDHPMDPIVIYPTHDTKISGRETTGSIADNNSHVEFYDPSPKNRAADWYELWISYDDPYTGGRLMDLESNPTFNNWYKLIVDSSELQCTDRAGDTGRICTIEIVSPTIATATPGTKFNWWVRGWNEEFQEEEAVDGNGWSDKGSFIADDNTVAP